VPSELLRTIPGKMGRSFAFGEKALQNHRKEPPVLVGGEGSLDGHPQVEQVVTVSTVLAFALGIQPSLQLTDKALNLAVTGQRDTRGQIAT